MQTEGRIRTESADMSVAWRVRDVRACRRPLIMGLISDGIDKGGTRLGPMGSVGEWERVQGPGSPGGCPQKNASQKFWCSALKGEIEGLSKSGIIWKVG